jgi:16S rRNA (guanine(966)-N(2))-methyltransferase RsmD
MRIIAGTLRSRTVAAPAGVDTRPTSDRLRETLFNVLAPRIEGTRFADLYAGSGAVGIEALSRGASRVTFVERAERPLSVLRANLEKLGLTGKSAVYCGSVKAFLRRQGKGAAAFDLVFLDPPYDLTEEYSSTLGLLGGECLGVLADSALVIAEHRKKERPAEAYGKLERTRLLEQGDAALSFYAANLGRNGT